MTKSQDPIVLAAQAREVLQKLHKRDDTVVRLKTDRSAFAEDRLDDLDRIAPGHFRADQKTLVLNLDTVLNGKPIPASLATVEDWRKYPVLAGVAAHESAHARFSLWESEGNELPTSIPNPDYDPEDPSTHTRMSTDPETGEETEVPVPESFSVDPKDGKLYDLAKILEEPRVERLGVKTFTKTWRRAMQYSATHLIMEQSDEDEANEISNIDSAVRTAVLVGGRVSAGTLGVSHQSRTATKNVLAAVQKLIETELADRIASEPGFDPYFEMIGLISDAVFLNDHTDATAQLEIARKILKIVYPENQDNPDDSGGEDGEGEEGDGGGAGSSSGKSDAIQEAMKEAMDGLIEQMREETRVEEEQPEGGALQDSGGHGATIYKNPRAPQIDHYEKPNADDRALYHRALTWMENQIEPTVIETEYGQWLPGNGARLDVRSHIRDNLAGHIASQRSDWNVVSETVQPAPPVRVAIMLDGSGSMSSHRRQSASIAWAASNAAAQLPESRTVSVVFGAAAQVTQKPGHDPVRELAVSRTDGPWENFGEAVELVEEALWLDEDNAVDPHDPTGIKATNTLIIVVSDLAFGGSATFRGRHMQQAQVFTDVTKEWAERGYNTVVIGAHGGAAYARRYGLETDHVKLIDTVSDLFKSER